MDAGEGGEVLRHEKLVAKTLVLVGDLGKDAGLSEEGGRGVGVGSS